MNTRNVYTRAIALGAVAGLRSMMAPALLTGAPACGNRALLQRVAPSPRKTNIVLGVLSLGELVADKLPKTPSRLRTGPLLGRIVSGALVGAAVCKGAKRSMWLGATLGAAAAGGAAVLGYAARKLLVRKTGIADPVWGMLEDVVAFGLGKAALLRS